VRVAADAGQLELEVRSRGGRPGDARGAGLGLAMLRERAEALGGTFFAGRDTSAPGRDGETWVVRATLPLEVRT
jgi:signal transduction histidine kinase